MKKIKLHNPFKELTRFEWILWIVSIVILLATFIIGGERNPAIIAATLVGVTGLVFIARGDVWGHICTIVFAILYSIVSVSFMYYGEFITYAFMTLPLAAISLISWLRHPFEDSKEVKVGHMNKKKWLFAVAGTAAATVIFFFVLKAFKTNSLVFSTISIATSFLAATLTAFRSHLYAAAYAANDIVLIVLWIIATIEDPQYLPMVISFSIFLVQDIYGLISWKRMKKRQHGTAGEDT